MNGFSKVQVWEEIVSIPTYGVGAPDKNPLFLEKRVYQGSSGKVYPHLVIDKIYDTPEPKQYKAVFLENDYLQIMILPELGGRVQRAYDKMRGYDFVYYNHVIKPALVGLAGPWISGGIEFNWPQHHRPSTFDEVNYTFCEHPDGSATVFVNEIEGMFHTQGGTAFTLYPDKAYLELKNEVYNRTNTNQTFLWWANPAVAADGHYRSIFPPDVTAVMDHGKRAVSTFPIATGTYYKVDYSRGVDISRYENLPVPTSYMAAKSDFDFVGGYDESAAAGLLHIADHHISPGKKQWTWGCGDFGKAWDRNLTDEDGPYLELMTGCFTDNQPDFSHLAPMESKSFTQYFLPYHDLGTVHNATKDLILRLETGEERITAYLYVSGQLGICDVEFYAQNSLLFHKEAELNCGETVCIQTKNEGYVFEDITVAVKKDGHTILSFCGDIKKQEIPAPAEAAPLPADCETCEDLYLYGMHIEQYRHATRRAEDYYLEGLRRDASDIRLNNAYGTLLLKKGCFEESETYFRRAVKKQTRSNPNPSSGECYFNLGLSLYYQERLDEAFDAFYKAIWNQDAKSAAYVYLALICSRKKEYTHALEFAEQALLFHAHNFHALNLKTMLLYALGNSKAAEHASYVLSLAPLNILGLKLAGKEVDRHILNPNMLIDVSLEYANAGFYEEAITLLGQNRFNFPLIGYYQAYFAAKAGLSCKNYLEQAASCSPDCCFPNRLEDIKVLRFAMEQNPADFKAPYYLGNLLYDKERHEDAIRCFETSIALGCSFATPYRNLSLLTYNVRHDAAKALELLSAAFSMDKEDARVLYELDMLKKKTCVSAKERLAFLEEYLDIAEKRDDLYLEYITLLNLNGDCEKALKLLLARRFHPWEGGEGKVPEQYLSSLIAIAAKELHAGNLTDAESHLADTFSYPHSLGEGKLYGAQENRQNYYLGLVYEELGNEVSAKKCFEKASHGIAEPASAMYYNDQPPETIFYQGMALERLGNHEEAKLRFETLVSYADAHCHDEVTIDYFAVSLPDLLVFEEDLNIKNRLHCMFMKALGLYGLGNKEESKTLFENILLENCNAFQPAIHYQMLF